MTIEEWRPVRGYGGLYEVSSEGRVRSLDRMDTNGRTRKGVVLVNLMGASGYLQVNLHGRGIQKTYCVHKLVLLSFGVAPMDDEEVRHLNGIRTDNTISNLSWGTHLENMQDQREHRTHKNSVKTHCPSGHPYTGENLMYERNGNRRCAICRQQSWLRVSARRSAERRAA